MIQNSLVNELILNDAIISIALGGSRSRECHSPNSDYDLFCIVRNDSYDQLINSFSRYLESFSFVRYAAKMFYLENWGYLFKAIDLDNVLYDISILPLHRISEMSIRSTNFILKDTDNIYKRQIDSADDSKYEVMKLESERYVDYITLIGFEKQRFFDAINKNDYWYAQRCLERIKTYLIRCDRINRKEFSKSQSCPEKGYFDLDSQLKKAFIIDGTQDSLIETEKRLSSLCKQIIMDENLISRTNIVENEIITNN